MSQPNWDSFLENIFSLTDIFKALLIQTWNNQRAKLKYLPSQLRNYSEWNVKFSSLFSWFSLIWPSGKKVSFICDQFEMLILQQKKISSFHRVLAVLLPPCTLISEKIFLGFCMLEKVHRHRYSQKKTYARGIPFHKLFNLFYKHKNVHIEI